MARLHVKPVKLLLAYYAATALFMLLDYVFEINIRLTFLDSYPGWRIGYYLFCFVCLGLMLWRPGWSVYISTAESLLTLSLIILSVAIRVIIVTDDMIETGRGLVTLREMANFGIAFSVVYIGYWRNMRSLQRQHQDSGG